MFENSAVPVDVPSTVMLTDMLPKVPLVVAVPVHMTISLTRVVVLYTDLIDGMSTVPIDVLGSKNTCNACGAAMIMLCCYVKVVMDGDGSIAMI